MNKTSKRKALGLLLGSVLLAGCSMAPVYNRPAAPMPAHWQPGLRPEAAAMPTAAGLDWKEFVTDAHLRRMIALALTNNRDLRQALLNVEMARGMYRVQRADRLPGMSIQAAGTRQRVPADLGSSGSAQVQASWEAGLAMTAFELDLFGRVRNLSQAALQEYLATEEAARGARIALIAEVMQAYLAADSARQRRNLTQVTVESREKSLDLVKHRREAGAANALEYEEASVLLELAKADFERTGRESMQAANALALLVGVSDERLAFPEFRPAATLVRDIGAEAPSELLERRPDIRAAEHRLIARHADIGAARAAFFPRISLTGLLGSASGELSGLFESGQRSWSFSPQVALPIFDMGRNSANLDVAAVRKDMAVAAYELAIQTAFREAADALAAVATLRREERAREASARGSYRALQLAQRRYRSGVDDHMRYLDAQRSAYANEIELIGVRTQRQVALTTLFKAFGGGWSAGGPPGELAARATP